MALYPTALDLNDSLLPDNDTQQISPLDHRTVNEAIIEYCGAAQVYGFPQVDDIPGTPENPRAYIALPGTYTNFGNLTITAPLGILFWNGEIWTAIQLTIPSPFNYFKAKTTGLLEAGTTYTSIGILQASGGWNAYAGQWVQLVNRRTGEFDFVQLTADIEPSDTEINFVSKVMVKTMAVDSIVELYPMINFRWWRNIPTATEGLSYVDMPAGWRPPPAQAVDYTVYMELLGITRNGYEMQYNATPTEELHYRLKSDNRLRIELGTPLLAGEIIRVKLWQPAVLEVYA